MVCIYLFCALRRANVYRDRALATDGFKRFCKVSGRSSQAPLVEPSRLGEGVEFWGTC